MLLACSNLFLCVTHLQQNLSRLHVNKWTAKHSYLLMVQSSWVQNVVSRIVAHSDSSENQPLLL